ncbi:TIGR01620 family protein [Aliivibrio fischeri]|uniref:YcjF family protein n=1 Tax=Aliivibrio fischeri TaxID=668 RepID=UPI00080DE3C8|nr:TIGR01620 family protein [Aliivibrio fischeri]OCH32179.1 TIGR01620 family protein [Aliivibrio fischeri]
MSELKKQRVFQSQELKQQDVIEALNTQKLFNDNVTFIPQKTEDEEELDSSDIEMPLIKKGTHWSIKTLVIGFLGLTLWQSIDHVITAIQSADFLSLGWAGLISFAALLGVTAIGRELLTLRKLKDRAELQEQVTELIDGNGIGQAKVFCEGLARKNLKLNPIEYTRWQNIIEPHHSNAEVFEMYDSMVISVQDKRAKALISKHAGESALMVALSPLAVVDMLLVAWRNIRLIEQVSEVYGVELGYWGRLRLFKMVLQNMAFAGATEIATDVGVDMLSTGLAGKLSTRAAQGLGIGLITARFGLKTMDLMRPLPWMNDEVPKLSDMRKTIVAQLVSKLGAQNSN